MSEMTVGEATAAIHAKLEANGAQPIAVRVQPRGKATWFAEVRLEGSDDVRQGAFTSEELEPFRPSSSPMGTPAAGTGG